MTGRNEYVELTKGRGRVDAVVVVPMTQNSHMIRGILVNASPTSSTLPGSTKTWRMALTVKTIFSTVDAYHNRL